MSVHFTKLANMNASMLLDHINVHAHQDMSYNPVESAKVRLKIEHLSIKVY